MSSKNIFEAMFDIRPNGSGGFSNEKRKLPRVIKLVFEKDKDQIAKERMEDIKPILSKEEPPKVEDKELKTEKKVSSEEASQISPEVETKTYPETVQYEVIKKEIPQEEFKLELDVATVDYALPGPEEIIEEEKIEEISLSDEPNQVGSWLTKIKEDVKPSLSAIVNKQSWYKNRKKLGITGGLIALALFASLAFTAKNSGEKAVSNLETAKISLENFDFENAAINFSLAQESFKSASRNLNLLGLNMTALFKGIPGFDKINSTKQLIEAGEKLAKAGENLSLSLDRFSKTNFISYFGLNGEDKESLSIFVDSFRKPILQAKIYIEDANLALASIDDDVIPEDKKEVFNELKEKLPLFEGFIQDAVEYSDFLSAVVGEGDSRKYLIIFQNTSELRATGGFPGSYALVTLEKGYFGDIFVDDIYNPDGQIKENIIPPKPLQHITPNWGMRDANWFADFPTSAKKIIEFYEKGSGGIEVDGIFSMTPELITTILEVTGEIELPQYGVTLGASNFLDAVQKEVEYGEREEGTHSKTILSDFTPLFLEKLSNLSQEKWVEVSEALFAGIMKKQVLAYFIDENLQRVAVKNNFGGEVKNPEGDFLLVVHSNIKGSKTDAYTDTRVRLDTVLEDGVPRHKLSITRKHNGGNTEFGFYNRQNPDYIRVYVPKGSKLLSIKGADRVDHDPLIGYKNSGFVNDPDLVEYESTIEKGRNNVEFLEESGKDVFAFWLVLDPGEEDTVVLEYTSPIKVEDGEYKIYIQKQSGTIGQKLEYSFEVPSNLNLIYKSPYLGVQGNKVILNSNLDEDREVEVRFQ